MTNAQTNPQQVQLHHSQFLPGSDSSGSQSAFNLVMFFIKERLNSSQRLMGKPLGLSAQPEPGVTWVSPRRISCTPANARIQGHPRALPVSFSSVKPRAPLPKPLSLLEQHLDFQQCPSLTLEELLPLAQPWALPGAPWAGGAGWDPRARPGQEATSAQCPAEGCERA